MTTRPKRTPFQTKKEPTAGGNNPQPMKFVEGDPPLRQENESPAVFTRPNFNVGRKRSEQKPIELRAPRQQSVDEPKVEDVPPPTVASKRNIYPGLVEVGKRIIPSGEEQPPQASGVDRVLIRPNLGLKNKRKEYDLLMPPPPPQQTSITPKSPSFNEGYPQRKSQAIRNSQLMPEITIERNPSFVPEMGPPPLIFTGDLQDLEININQDSKHVSLGKVQRQKQRAQQLRKLLNLELDTYQPMLNIGSTTQYDSYISRIKGGYINNSQDQAFDDTMDGQCQTLPLAFEEFSQQCPEDRNRAYLGGMLEGQRVGQSLSLYKYTQNQ